jgi:hypothetical protein
MTFAVKRSSVKFGFFFFYLFSFSPIAEALAFVFTDTARGRGKKRGFVLEQLNGSQLIGQQQTYLSAL